MPIGEMEQRIVDILHADVVAVSFFCAISTITRRTRSQTQADQLSKATAIRRFAHSWIRCWFTKTFTIFAI